MFRHEGKQNGNNLKINLSLVEIFSPAKGRQDLNKDLKNPVDEIERKYLQDFTY